VKHESKDTEFALTIGQTGARPAARYRRRMSLTILPVNAELLEQWREVHNSVIVSMQLTAEDVAERAVRNTLTVGYVDAVLVGNATVRAPEDGVITIIVRVLPEHRRKGLGSEYLKELLCQTSTSRVGQIKTVVLAANVDGLAFAVHHGFTETTRYEVDGVAFVELTLRDATPRANRHGPNEEQQTTRVSIDGGSPRATLYRANDRP